MLKLNYSYIGLGSNLGDKLQNIHLAYTQIQSKVGDICRKSSIFQTPPWGFEAKEDFFNSVILIKTKLSAIELLTQLKKIEEELGRDTSFKVGYSSRIIDLDILDFNNEILGNTELVVPHPHIEKRNFVLYPLFEINDNWTHPISGVSIKTLVKECEDKDQISKVKV